MPPLRVVQRRSHGILFRNRRDPAHQGIQYLVCIADREDTQAGAMAPPGSHQGQGGFLQLFRGVAGGLRTSGEGVRALVPRLAGEPVRLLGLHQRVQPPVQHLDLLAPPPLQLPGLVEEPVGELARRLGHAVRDRDRAEGFFVCLANPAGHREPRSTLMSVQQLCVCPFGLRSARGCLGDFRVEPRLCRLEPLGGFAFTGRTATGVLLRVVEPPRVAHCGVGLQDGQAGPVGCKLLFERRLAAAYLFDHGARLF